jgi:motility quorum-sensing regulator / GCU-specific mRNA interferase toxin
MIPKVKEKRKPHYVLSVLKELFRNEKTRHITKLAHKGAVTMGYMDDDDMLTVISRLCSEHFYKSMTMYENHKVWQDVYRYQDGEKALYIKLQLSVDGQKAILIQMKRDEGRDE